MEHIKIDENLKFIVLMSRILDDLLIYEQETTDADFKICCMNIIKTILSEEAKIITRRED